MYKEDQEDMKKNINDFCEEYERKFVAGAKEHGGKFRDIGLLDQIQNAKEEILDMWSYVSAIERQVEEIRELYDYGIPKYESDYMAERTLGILNGTKDERR